MNYVRAGILVRSSYPKTSSCFLYRGKPASEYLFQTGLHYKFHITGITSTSQAWKRGIFALFSKTEFAKHVCVNSIVPCGFFQTEGKHTWNNMICFSNLLILLLSLLASFLRLHISFCYFHCFSCVINVCQQKTQTKEQANFLQEKY